MRIFKLALAVSTMICLAVTSTLARDSESSSGSKARTTKQSKASRSKSATAKRKASAAARRVAAKKASAKRKQVTQLRSTGDIDVRGTDAGELPPEELPVSEQEETDDEDLLPAP